MQITHADSLHNYALIIPECSVVAERSITLLTVGPPWTKAKLPAAGRIKQSLEAKKGRKEVTFQLDKA